MRGAGRATDEDHRQHSRRLAVHALERPLIPRKGNIYPIVYRPIPSYPGSVRAVHASHLGLVWLAARDACMDGLPRVVHGPASAHLPLCHAQHAPHRVRRLDGLLVNRRNAARHRHILCRHIHLLQCMPCYTSFPSNMFVYAVSCRALNEYQLGRMTYEAADTRSQK
jgi:hypothetical protein